ncbi:MAG TPA: hypothetical protein VFE14_20940 [Micromonosporaceae bacterium]|nr:hypothetical protein [Micromonosporaceae bacterium]
MYACDIYGCSPQVPAGTGVAAPTAYMGTDDIAVGVKGLLDPNNPLFWFGVVLAVTFGAVGMAGSVRLGRARLSGSLDKA